MGNASDPQIETGSQADSKALATASRAGASEDSSPGHTLQAFSPETQSRSRLDAIDLLRGLVMVIMALDHVRDYFSYAAIMTPGAASGSLTRRFIDPADLSMTTPGLFLTRWVTHYCAPTFIFLAGTGAFLYGSRGKTRGQLSWFLLTRGLWLVVLELTLVRLGWNFAFDYRHEVDGKVTWDFGAGVLWGIGWSMVVLGCLVYLPTSFVAALGIGIIVFHNQMDSFGPEQFGRFGWLWTILHSPGTADITPTIHFGSGYAILPWVGVIAAGYGFGAFYLLDARERSRQLLGLGLAIILAFVALRTLNQYGDLRYPPFPGESVTDVSGRAGPWSERDGGLFTAFAFLNCQKYPPSLLFVLMTLGPAIIALALFERAHGPLARFFIVFGRVPLFFYLLHIPLIHALAVGLDYWAYGKSPLATAGYWGLDPNEVPADYGHSLPVVYLIWLGVVLALYPLCWWFARVKRRSKSAWLSYL
jgi:uncharacterized membrane protein